MKHIKAIAVAVILTFIVTENYLISTMQVSENSAGYSVTVFGTDFQK